MRTAKILSMLFSLGQLLLVLKLIEYVRGDPIHNSSHLLGNLGNGDTVDTDSVNDQRNSRHFFFAPRGKEKKYKPWFTTTETPSTDYPYEEVEKVDSNDQNQNLTSLSQDRLDNDGSNSTSEDGNGSGRLCPGCEGGTCGGNVVPYGLPVTELVIAKIVGVIWFFIFLFIWYYLTKPPKSGYAPSPSAGYGYGSSGSTGWSPSSGSSGSSGFLGSFLNLFGGGDQRSLESFTEFTSLITDAIHKLSMIYADP